MYKLSITAYRNQKQSETETLFDAVTIYVPTKHMPLKYHIVYIPYKLVHAQVSDNYASIHASYEFTAITSVTKNTVIHIVHIVGVWLWINILDTLQINIPLHV